MPPEGEVARQLVGRWNLVSLEAVRPNGEVVCEPRVYRLIWERVR